MNIVSVIVVFTVIWWLVFFIALPIGIEQEKNPEKGNDSGAPKNPMIKKKMLYTTLVTILLTYVYYLIAQQDFFQLPY